MKYLTVLSVALLLASGQVFAQSADLDELQGKLMQQKEELQKLKDTMQSSQRDLEALQEKIKGSDYESIQLSEKIEALCDKLSQTSAGKMSNPVCRN